MNIKIIFTIVAIIAAFGMIVPNIISHTVSADKGGIPNGNAGDNPFKSCVDHPEQNKCPLPPP